MAYPFKTVKRNIDLFPSNLTLNGKRGDTIQSYCVIQYHYTDQDGKEQWAPDYIRAALLWGEDMLQISDKTVDFYSLCSSAKQYTVINCPQECKQNSLWRKSASLRATTCLHVSYFQVQLVFADFRLKLSLEEFNRVQLLLCFSGEQRQRGDLACQ